MSHLLVTRSLRNRKTQSNLPISELRRAVTPVLCYEKTTSMKMMQLEKSIQLERWIQLEVWIQLERWIQLKRGNKVQARG